MSNASNYSNLQPITEPSDQISASLNILSSIINQFTHNNRIKIEFTTNNDNCFHGILHNCSSNGILELKKIEVLRGIESMRTRIIDQILVRSDRIKDIKILCPDYISSASESREASYRVSNNYRSHYKTQYANQKSSSLTSRSSVSSSGPPSASPHSSYNQVDNSPSFHSLNRTSNAADMQDYYGGAEDFKNTPGTQINPGVAAASGLLSEKSSRRKLMLKKLLEDDFMTFVEQRNSGPNTIDRKENFLEVKNATNRANSHSLI